MPTCAVNSCKNKSTTSKREKDGITFYFFPAKQEMKQRWLDVIPVSKNITKNSVVCNLHFKPEDFFEANSRRMLKPNAVPSIFQPTNNSCNAFIKPSYDISPPSIATSMQNFEGAQKQQSDSSGNEIKLFCPNCNTEIHYTVEGIQEEQTKILVANVYRYFEHEYEGLKTVYGDLDLTPLSEFRQRTALATGVSESTILQILQEEEERNAEKQETATAARQEPPEKQSRDRKRLRQTESSIVFEDSSDDNVDNGVQTSCDLEAQNVSEIETLVVKLESPESYDFREQIDIDPISTEVKEEPPDDDIEKEIEPFVVTETARTKEETRRKIEVTSIRGQIETDPISTEVKEVPPDVDIENAIETFILNELPKTERKRRKIPKITDIRSTRTRQSSQGSQNIINETGHQDQSSDLDDQSIKRQRQHLQGESSTTAASSSVQLTQVPDESCLLEDTNIKWSP